MRWRHEVTKRTLSELVIGYWGFWFKEHYRICLLSMMLRHDVTSCSCSDGMIMTSRHGVTKRTYWYKLVDMLQLQVVFGYLIVWLVDCGSWKYTILFVLRPTNQDTGSTWVLLRLVCCVELAPGRHAWSRTLAPLYQKRNWNPTFSQLTNFFVFLLYMYLIIVAFFAVRPNVMFITIAGACKCLNRTIILFVLLLLQNLMMVSRHGVTFSTTLRRDGGFPTKILPILCLTLFVTTSFDVALSFSPMFPDPEYDIKIIRYILC